MGIIVGALTNLAKSETGQNFFKWATTEKGKSSLCTKMPLVETAIATASRVYATEKQKNLSRREKNVLNAGHVAPAIFGVLIGSKLNKKVYNIADNIVKYLDPNKVKDIPLIKNALRVCLPIGTTAILMRLILPVTTSFVTGEIEEYRAKKKLDIKV